MLIARYLCSNRDTTRFDGGEEKRGKRIRIERDRSIEVHAMVPVTRIPRRGTSSISATSNREGWFTSVFPRRLDLPLAKPTTAESKPIRADHAWTDQSSSLFLSFVTFLLPRVAPSSGPTLSQDISVILFFSFFLLLHPSTSPIFLYISSVRDTLNTRQRESREERRGRSRTLTKDRFRDAQRRRRAFIIFAECEATSSFALKRRDIRRPVFCP